VRPIIITLNLLAALATILMIAFGGATSPTAFLVAAANLACIILLGIESSVKRQPGLEQNMLQQFITLRRRAVRLSYLAQEGTLSKTGDTVRFDAEGPDAANEFMDSIMAIIEAVP
jgi:hypothetical protein